MAFDTQTRNRLNAFVGEARRLITREFTEKFQSLYGISAEGGITDLAALGHLDEAQLGTAALLRSRIDYLVRSHPDDKGGVPTAIARVAREQAFTVLNRLAALRMAEKRGLIVESVGGGYRSKGFQVFERVAGSALGDSYLRYRRYLFCLFDELAVDLGALFDRRSPQGILFPREPALLALLELLNAPDLEELWAEDETIGWIYQYYNDEAERTQMRKESSAPRNSRELAVRNQFFTPRYVVEFLTDNTLGRIWYEMRHGQTHLKEQCRYLVRRPNEIFLKPGEPAPEPAETNGNLSQEELLRQAVHIPHRPLKDPREFRLLDPACGSMHFGLYAFDLFTVIYDEAWEIAHGTDDAAKSAETFAPFVTFAASFADKAAFLRDVPRLIVEHNIHGIDIDPRAAQIAGLSLWLRAQRAWHQAGVKPADRPRITRSNLVCAEPMPGEKELLREFVESAFPAGERPAFAFLLEKIFDCMTLAGEAGSLLRIEEEIRAAIAEAKRLWKEEPKHEQATLFPEATAQKGQGEMRLDLSGITDEQFWERAEQRIYDALEAYAEQAENGGGFQRRLFADDAAQGFAFIDLCRKRYDVAVMNPPFGEPSVSALDYLRQRYSILSDNLYCGFFSRMLERLAPVGLCGAITDRSFLTKQAYEPLRRAFIDKIGPQLVADLGWGVLDANVETCVSICSERKTKSLFTNVSDAADGKADALLQLAVDTSRWIAEDLSTFASFPFCSFAYSMPEWMRRGYRDPKDRFETSVARVARGMAGANAEHLYRVIAEVPRDQIGWNKRWTLLQKGSPYSPFYFGPEQLLLSEERSFKSVLSYDAGRITGFEDYGLPGLAFGKRTDFMYAYVMQPRQVFSVEGQAVFPHSSSSYWQALAIINSSAFQSLVNQICGQHKYHGYVNAVHLKAQVIPDCSNSTRTIWEALCRIDSHNETAAHFVLPRSLQPNEVQASLLERIQDVNSKTKLVLETCSQLHREINSTVEQALGVDTVVCGGSTNVDYVQVLFGEIDSEQLEASSIGSYVIGAVFGRWDIRYATGERPAPELPDPFAPLQVCPPGMLQGDDGLPLSPEAARRLRTEGRYPLDVAWDGILVDDPEHPLDLERRVHAALAVLWADRADALEHESCALLGVPTLREWFRRPAGFFADHLKRYSKSRRQAPIYWPLSTASGSYTLWIYYHRLTDQTLHTAIADFIDPKLKSLDHEVSAQREKPGGGGSKLADLIEFRGELLDLKAELERIIKLPWKPNLNDGVLITASPLWKLFRLSKWQKDLKTCWQELEKGDYDWAHLAYSIWPKRVEEVCKTDRSIAIAHGLEHLCQLAPPKPKKERKTEQADPESDDGLLEGFQEPTSAAKVTAAATAVASVAVGKSVTKQLPLAADGENRIDIEDTDRDEVMCRIRQVFGEGGPRERETALKQLSQSLGYQRLGTKVREILERDLLTAVRRGILVNESGQLRLAADSVDQVSRDELKDEFLAAIGRAWIDREDAARSFARFLGYARTGPVLEETSRSLINGLIREGRLEANGPQVRRT
jgi:hypothetical protein